MTSNGTMESDSTYIEFVGDIIFTEDLKANES